MTAKSKAFLVTATARSTARTEAPASSPLRDAIYLIGIEGTFGARQYAARMPDTARWVAVRRILSEEVSSRLTRQANITHLRHLIRKRGE